MLDCLQHAGPAIPPKQIGAAQDERVWLQHARPGHAPRCGLKATRTAALSQSGSASGLASLPPWVWHALVVPAKCRCVNAQVGWAQVELFGGQPHLLAARQVHRQVQAGASLEEYDMGTVPIRSLLLLQLQTLRWCLACCSTPGYEAHTGGHVPDTSLFDGTNADCAPMTPP